MSDLGLGALAPTIDNLIEPEAETTSPMRPEAMDPEHLRELCRKETSYWWHVNKRTLVLSLLERYTRRGDRLLEVGCGAGYLSGEMSRSGLDVVAADISPDAARFTRRRGARDAMVLDATRPWPFAVESFDTVLLLDVLEHLEDDVTALKQAERTLRPGGRVILTVPAHGVLFSPWDAMVGHERRYARRRLKWAARQAGLKPLRLTAWNLISLPPALVLRTRDRLFGSRQAFAEFPNVPERLNALLKWWGRTEAFLAVRWNLRCGLSFAAVLAKDEESV